MTDNRTTELLDGLRNVGNLHEFAELFGFNWHDESDWTWHDVAVKMADELEQAIAATLRSESPYDELLHCLENDWHISASWDGLRKFWCVELTEEGVRLRDATHGMLTAEQVREAIFNGSSYASYDGAKYYADGIGMQAIADELNAHAERTCKPSWVLQGESQTQEFWRCECGNCGECFGVEDRSSFPFKMTIDEVEIPNFCPNCGWKVESE